MTLSEAIDRYCAVHFAGSQTSSPRNHRRHAERLIAWLGRDPDLRELDDATLARWWAQRGKQVSGNTVYSEALLILALLRWGHRKGWCEWPDVRPPSRVYRVPQALSIDQVGQLLAAAQRLTGRHRGVPASVRWRAYILVALATGERFAAVRQLAWSDLDGDLLTVRAETRKGGCREACHRLPSTVVAAWRDLQQHGERAPFGWLSETAIYAHWHALRQIADLPEWCTPHTLRRTAASHCRTLEEARRLLGHSSAAVTMRHYRDPRQVDETPQSALLDALAKPRRTWLGWLTG